MTLDEARLALATYRPWADAADADFAAALAVVRQSAEGQKWFAAHCEAQLKIRAQFQHLPVPPGLKEQILSETKASRPKAATPRARLVLATAAGLLLAAVLAVMLLSERGGSGEQVNLAGFRTRMVKTALRSYGMELETNSLVEIRSFLGQRGAHADFQLPAALGQTEPTGCGVLSWQGRRVTMVCFHSGQPLPAGQKTDLFLFVIDRAGVPGAPVLKQPLIETAGKMRTASWQSGECLYLLAAEGDEAFLKRQL
jgi:hypothetical protein